MKRIALLVCLYSAFLVSAIKAETLTIGFQNSTSHTVHMQLYSKTRSWLWPAYGQAYILDRFTFSTTSISCLPGERICYGAWPIVNYNIYWGAGRGGIQGCTTCCFVCGVNYDPVNLIESYSVD